MSDGMARGHRDHEQRIGHTEVKEVPLVQTGTWTPAFAGTGTAGSFTYVAGSQGGTYIRQGKLVIARGRLFISAIGVAPVGSMTITGLPFTSAAAANSFGGIAFSRISNFNYAAGAMELTGFVGLSSTSVALEEAFDNAAAVAAPAANFTNVNCDLIFTVTYEVD